MTLTLAPVHCITFEASRTETVGARSPRPILSRLPIADGERTISPQDKSYIHPSPLKHIPGTLPWSISTQGLTYTNARLPQLDEFGQHAWAALHHLQAISNVTAKLPVVPTSPKAKVPPTTCPVKAAASSASIDLDFNWSELYMPKHLEGTLHGVVFRSSRAPGSTSTDLYEADRLAHEEAVNAGGLLMYWYGTPDASGKNLATCIWTDKESAKAASKLPKHREAVKHAMRAYSSFELSEYRVEKRKGESHFRVFKDSKVRHCSQGASDRG